MQIRTSIFLLLFLGFSGVIVAQETDNIGTETVTVVKPYSPTVSDAFKIKSAPDVNDSIALQKKSIDYNIFSVPVASTFTPAKGKASRVKKTPPPTLYNTYASLGLGNYNNALLDFYTSQELNRREDFLDVGLKHFSSRGDIDFTPLNTEFYNTDLDVSYQKKDREMNWGASLGLQHQLYNWYGVDDEGFNQVLIAGGIDETQNYFNAQATAHLELEDSYFKKGDILLRRFWDATDSGENRVVVNSNVELPITDQLLNIGLKVDFVNGSFENTSLNNTVNDAGINYGEFQAGITPSLLVLQDDFTLNLGARFVYSLETENSDSNFFIYPAVTASYRLLEENVIAYGGVEGQLSQNSYYDFVAENPFVSPTLTIQPTDRQYDAYVGLKGQLTSNVGYNIKGSYTAENRKPLFLMNPQNLFRTDEAYTFGNSFQLFYDDVKTLGIFAELNVDVNRNFTLGINAEFNDYDTETDNPAWNLPSISGSLFMDYQINDQWFLGANLFYVGERDDLMAVALENTAPADFPSTIVTLDGFFDANAHLGYRFNEQLSIFVKASNLANNDYQRWANFRVQGFQALAGVSYKFDL